MGKLQDKVAIVTGASSGIGRAIARSLGGEGAAVVLAGRTKAPMAACPADLNWDGVVNVVDLLILLANWGC